MKLYYTIPAVIVVLAVVVLVVGRIELTPEQAEFKKLCETDGKQWMLMEPMKDGKTISDKKCWGCMVDDNNMICDQNEYTEFIKLK